MFLEQFTFLVANKIKEFPALKLGKGKIPKEFLKVWDLSIPKKSLRFSSQSWVLVELRELIVSWSKPGKQLTSFISRESVTEEILFLK